MVRVGVDAMNLLEMRVRYGVRACATGREVIASAHQRNIWVAVSRYRQERRQHNICASL